MAPLEDTKRERKREREGKEIKKIKKLKKNSSTTDETAQVGWPWGGRNKSETAQHLCRKKRCGPAAAGQWAAAAVAMATGSCLDLPPIGSSRRNSDVVKSKGNLSFKKKIIILFLLTHFDLSPSRFGARWKRRPQKTKPFSYFNK